MLPVSGRPLAEFDASDRRGNATVADIDEFPGRIREWEQRAAPVGFETATDSSAAAAESDAVMNNSEFYEEVEDQHANSFEKNN